MILIKLVPSGSFRALCGFATSNLPGLEKEMTCPFYIPALPLTEALRARPREVNIDHTKTGEAERSDGSEKLNWKGQAARMADHVGMPRRK